MNPSIWACKKIDPLVTLFFMVYLVCDCHESVSSKIRME